MPDTKQDQNEVLEDFTGRLDKLGIEHMLTGSMAMAHYAMPRSTVDIDIVVNIREEEIESFIAEFGDDYYIPLDRTRESVSTGRMFNILHEQTVMKIDCIPLRSDSYQENAFGRRKREIYTDDFSVWIISKEDLILSKLQWAQATGSELQLRDITNIMRNGFDGEYIDEWKERLGVSGLFKKCLESIHKNDAG